MGVNRNGPDCTGVERIGKGVRWGGRARGENLVTVGREYMGTGGRTDPSSRVKGEGFEPALLERTDNWAEKSWRSEADNTENMCSSRNVM